MSDRGGPAPLHATASGAGVPGAVHSKVIGRPLLTTARTAPRRAACGIRAAEQPAHGRRHPGAVALLARPAAERPAPEPVHRDRHPPHSARSPAQHRGPRRSPPAELGGRAPPSRPAPALIGVSWIAGGKESTGCPRNAPATGEASAALRYQSPASALESAPPARSTCRGPLVPSASDPVRPFRSAGPRGARPAAPFRVGTTRDRPSSASDWDRAARTPAPAAGRPRVAYGRGTGCPSRPAPARRTTPGGRGDGEDVQPGIGARFGISCATRTPAARGPRADARRSSKASRPRAAPFRSRRVRRASCLLPRVASTRHAVGRGAADGGDLELERDRVARGHPGRTRHAGQREIGTRRAREQPDADPAQQVRGMSRGVLDLPVGHDDDRTVGRRCRGERGSEQRPPASGSVSAGPRSSPNRRISPQRAAESRASAQRAAGRRQAERGVEQHQRAAAAPRHRAAQVEEEEAERGPGNRPADQGHPAATSGALEPEIGVGRQSGGEHQD